MRCVPRYTARSLSHSLGGKWHGNYGTAPCPVCQASRRPDQNALSVRGAEGKLLLYCHKSACAFEEILTAAGLERGDFRPPGPAEAAGREVDRKADAAKKAQQAQRCWNAARPAEGTIAEAYLRKARGITCPLPNTLRFHPACWHGATARRHPALVALVEGSDSFAVHRTYLRADGTGKADVQPAKTMLGTVAGGAVRLAKADGCLAVAEGIETALSLSSGLLPKPATVWAALSTSGLRKLRLPAMPQELIIALDGDRPGRAAAHALAERAHSAGWTVFLAEPPASCDWNDVLRGKVYGE